MRFGAIVIVRRGGGACKGAPGCRRFVRGVLVGARGNEYQVRLLEDDPLDTVGWNKAGMIGHWSKMAVKEEKKIGFLRCEGECHGGDQCVDYEFMLGIWIHWIMRYACVVACNGER